MKRILLASKSPRRIELLGRLVDAFDTEESLIEEKSAEQGPEKLVCGLAGLKAADVFSRNPDAVVIGADTVVAADGRILGKPRDEADALEMITFLAGKDHTVFTGVCVIAGDFRKSICSKTLVSFDKMTKEEIDAYIMEGDWSGKAGAYGIQGAAAKHITGIAGDYYNVMGLPLNVLYKLLKEIM